jgi:hypothetical protein
LPLRALIVGAGASIDECNRSGNDSPLIFPSIKNFAKIMWQHFHPQPFLFNFLMSIGVEAEKARSAPLDEFVRLENEGSTNVERFFQFCYDHRSDYHETAWHDKQYQCFVMPITTIMAQKLFDNGHGWGRFLGAEQIIERLQSGDVVVSLNYDLIFDLTLERSGKPFGYVPMESDEKNILLAKPHGSVNMMVDEKGGTFAFAVPSTWGGGTHVENDSLCAGILPPRLNKNYRANPIAKIIIDAVSRFRPDTVTFWGVGFTESDCDLNRLYRRLARSARTIEIINPDCSVVRKLETILSRNVTHYLSLEHWSAASG